MKAHYITGIGIIVFFSSMAINYLITSQPIPLWIPYVVGSGLAITGTTIMFLRR